MKNKPSLPFHPFLIGLFPILSLYALNLEEVPLDQTFASVLITLAVTAVLFGLFRLLTRSWQRAALLASFWSILFFSFGKVYEWLLMTLPYQSLWSQANVVLAVWAALWILGTWALIRILRRTEGLTQIINIVSVGLLVTAAFPLASTLIHQVKAGTVEVQPAAQTTLQPGPGWSGEKPDIYYIILDGYARADVLERFYNIDNRPFIEMLQSKGFSVAANSHTNYWRTTLSLASSLNYRYLDELLELNPESGDYAPLETLIRENAVQRFLESQGYRTIAFETGFEMSEAQDADIFFENYEPVNHFERTLLSGTVAVFFMDQMAPEFHRNGIRTQFRQLGDTPAIPGPKFVFAHLMVPHPPFVFGADGSPVVPIGWLEGGTDTRTLQQYIDGYSLQLLYTNRLVEETVERILADAPTPPVIILQSDHGPGSLMDLYEAENTCAAERVPNFSAIYLPGKDSALIPDDITPVNLFRIVLNTYFDAGLELEENRMYGIAFLRPYDLHEFTGRLDYCPQLSAGAQEK